MSTRLLYHEFGIRGYQHVRTDRGEGATVWAEAGMTGWDGGHLHLACIEERTGRKMRPVVDLLVWVFDKTPNGGWQCRMSPDYVTSPEFQNQKRQ